MPRSPESAPTVGNVKKPSEINSVMNPAIKYGEISFLGDSSFSVGIGVLSAFATMACSC